MGVKLSPAQIEAIRAYGLLGTFLAAEVDALLLKAEVRRIPAGQVVFHRRQLADEIAWITGGRARAVLPGLTRDVDVMNLAGGTMLGFVGYTAQDRHLLEIRAITALEIVVLGRAQIQAALARHDQLFCRLMMAMSMGAADRVNLIQLATEKHFIPTL